MVGMAYFPFFLAAGAFFAAAFLAGAFFAAVFFAAGFAGADAAAFRRCFGAASVSFIGVIASPIAPDSMSTTSDHRMWYVETSPYGMTCVVGRLRADRNTFGFAPFVRMSTFLSATPRRSTSACMREVFGAS